MSGLSQQAYRVDDPTAIFGRLFGLPRDNTRITLLLLLTSVTGSVDAASYLGLGRLFTANMTGNVALIEFAAAGAPLLLRSAIALVAFIIGTVVGGRVARRSDVDHTWPRQVTIYLCVTFVSLLAVFLMWVGESATPAPDVLAALLALGMGVQGAAVKKLAVADLPTTVVTSTLTGLGADSRLATGSSIRWRRRAGAVAALLAGALISGLFFQVRLVFSLLPSLVVLAVVLGLNLVRPAGSARHGCAA